MSIVTEPTRKPTCAAHRLTPRQRLDLALDSLDERCCVSRLALSHGVSRKFVYQQQDKALDALGRAFCPAGQPDPAVLFRLPVTDAWLRQFVLACVLVGHSSLRGCQEMLDCLLGLPVSLGWVHSVVKDAIVKARAVNDRADLSRVLFAALDEIFQGGDPVLSVVDVESTYCCLLSMQEHRDGDSWALALMDLRRQHFAPRAAIADAGSGLRAGLKQASPDVPCRADVWHPLRDCGEVVRYLENRAHDAIQTADKLLRRLARRPADAPLRQRAEAAAREQDRAIALADDVALLADWLRRDVLSVAGPALAQRREWFDLVLGELLARRESCEHRIGPVCSLLSAQKEDLLAFVAQLDAELADLAAYAKAPESVLRELVGVQEMPPGSQRKWQRDARLRQELGGRYHELSGLVEALRDGVVRASSVVENHNSRVRNYLFLRKEVGGGYLDLLRYFLNHRRFLRSERPERVGKSPAELLSGQEQAHWLELLGYERFSRTQAA